MHLRHRMASLAPSLANWRHPLSTLDGYMSYRERDLAALRDCHRQDTSSTIGKWIAISSDTSELCERREEHYSSPGPMMVYHVVSSASCCHR